jgi:hypothetical protein
MIRYLAVSFASGLLFALMDGAINANALARRLFEVYRPIARVSVNAPAGLVIDLAYGFIMTSIFLTLWQALPGGAGWAKGASFALMVWFFRVVMSVVGQWMIINMPVRTSVYALVTGLGEMLVLGIFYGLTLKPPA